MGKALYNLSRTNGDPPLLLSATLATLTDQQVKQPLLCFDMVEHVERL
jgi:hypothetical protein